MGCRVESHLWRPAGLSSLHLDRDAYEVRLVPQAKSGSRRADYQLPGRPFPQFDLGLAAFTRFQLVHGDSADVAPVVDFELVFFFQRVDTDDLGHWRAVVDAYHQLEVHLAQP